jgi:hypothetical protein
MAGFSESNDFDISNPGGSYDFWLVKVDNTGTMEWERSFGGMGIEISYDIDNTLDGGYVVVGNTFSTDGDITDSKGESDFWLVKVDGSGNLIWERTFGGSRFDAAQAVVSSKDGGYYVVGNSKSSDGDVFSNNGENDIWMLKTDDKGNLLWQGSFGGSQIDFGYDVVEGEDGSVLLIGESQSVDFQGLGSKGKSDLVLIKLR